jgi:hypothetical protein
MYRRCYRDQLICAPEYYKVCKHRCIESPSYHALVFWLERKHPQLRHRDTPTKATPTKSSQVQVMPMKPLTPCYEPAESTRLRTNFYMPTHLMNACVTKKKLLF